MTRDIKIDDKSNSIEYNKNIVLSFNNNLFRFVQNYINNEIPRDYPKAAVYHIPVGKRTVQFYKKQNVEALENYSGIFSKLNFSVAKEIVDIAKTAFLSGKADKIMIVFNEFKNVIVQRPKVINLFPIESTADPKLKATKVKEQYNLDYIFEPEQKAILDDLLPKYVDIQLWRTLLESFASEQAARMMAMENATNNANDLIKYLELVFNKARQAAITKEMLEIVSGAEALKK